MNIFFGLKYKNFFSNLQIFVFKNDSQINSNSKLQNYFYKINKDTVGNKNFLVKSTIFCNNKYKIQKSFLDLHNIELFFANPLCKTLELKIFNKKINLFEGQSIIFELDSRNEVSFASNSVFLRPLIFSYNNKGCIDVLHS